MAICPISIRWKTYGTCLAPSQRCPWQLSSSLGADPLGCVLWMAPSMKEYIRICSQVGYLHQRLKRHKNVNYLTRRRDRSSLMGEMRPGLPSESTFCNTSTKKGPGKRCSACQSAGHHGMMVESWPRTWLRVMPRPQGVTGGGMGLSG